MRFLALERKHNEKTFDFHKFVDVFHKSSLGFLVCELSLDKIQKIVEIPQVQFIGKDSRGSGATTSASD